MLDILNWSSLNEAEKAAAMRRARVCYDHLAGEMGTMMFESMLARGYLRRVDDAITLTDAGRGLQGAVPGLSVRILIEAEPKTTFISQFLESLSMTISLEPNKIL